MIGDTADDFPLGCKVRWKEVSGAVSIGVVTYHHSRYTVVVKWTTGDSTFISTGVLESGG